MRITARFLTLVVALAWIAAWLGALWLMWRPALEARLTFTDFDAVADITTGGPARLLVSLVALAAIALAVPPLMLALAPARLGARPPLVTRPAAATPDDVAAVRSRVDRLEEEVRGLREAMRGTADHPAGLVPPAEPSQSADNHAHV
jgi:hypothetical protein